MGFILLGLLLLFVIPIILGIIFLFRSKKMAILIFSVPFIVVIGLFGWWVFEANHHFVRSTDLANEFIGGIALWDELNESFIETYGDYTENDNVYYKESLNFERLSIGTNDEDEIIYMRTLDPEMQTEQSIEVGDSIQTVKDTYGDRFYMYRDMGMPDSINYVDRKNKIHLQFLYDENGVSEIILQKSSKDKIN